MSASIFSAVFDRNGHIHHYSDFTVIVFDGGAIVAPAVEAGQIVKWARSQMSRGAGTRNLSAFLDRFENLLAHRGSGVGTRGSPVVLSNLVKSIKATGLPLDDWSIPANLEESVDIGRAKPPEHKAGT